jgi:cytochrome P450
MAGSSGDIRLTSYAEVSEALLHRDLQQALFEESDVFQGAHPDGTLLVLHGDEHKLRRRVEQPHFRRGIFLERERHDFRRVIRDALSEQPDGSVDLVKLARQITVRVSAITNGLALGDSERAADELIDLLTAFMHGALIVHTRKPKDVVRQETRTALAQFDARHVAPAVAVMERGEDPGDATLLGSLLEHQDRLGLSYELLVRELGMFMLAAFNTSSVGLVHTFDEIFRHAKAEGFAARAAEDVQFAKTLVHEGIRLHPSSPEYMRRATRDVRLDSGVEIGQGRRVLLDLMRANRDTTVFGGDAAAFRPGRELPRHVPPWGVSFGGGMHFCMGQELAAGSPVGARDRDRTVGTVTLMLHEFLAAGLRPDPDRAPELSSETVRHVWATYPVVR